MNIEALYQSFLECNSKVDIDSRSITKGSMFFGIKGENFDGNKFAKEALRKGAKIAIIDSIDLANKYRDNVIIVEDSLKTLQDLALFHRRNIKSKIIAITGSNGKTTSKELISSVLSSTFKTISTYGNLNNHIGVPLSLLRIKEDTEFSVIEMGANNFGEIDFLSKITEPDFGYITNFGKAHLEGFKNIEGVIKGKTELYNWLINNGKTLILNFDDSQQRKFRLSNNFSFSSTSESSYKFQIIDDDNVIVECNGVTYESNLYGNYNFSNVCAAISIGLEFGIDSRLIQNKLMNYSSNNNRSELIIFNNKNVILDAYNANPSSVELAIKSFVRKDGTKAIILGDMFELGESSLNEHKKIIEFSENYNIDKRIFIGHEFFSLKNNHINNLFFKSKEDLYEEVGTLDYKNILIKGSRGMEMEQILKNNII